MREERITIFRENNRPKKYEKLEHSRDDNVSAFSPKITRL